MLGRLDSTAAVTASNNLAQRYTRTQASHEASWRFFATKERGQGENEDLGSLHVPPEQPG